MEPNDEFQDVGKKLPYMAPDNFFEKAAMKTLQEAKIRERKSRQIIYLWRSVAIAASLTALAILGFFMFQQLQYSDSTKKCMIILPHLAEKKLQIWLWK